MSDGLYWNIGSFVIVVNKLTQIDLKFNEILLKKMPKGRKRRTLYFSAKPEGFSGGICPFILLEQFQ